MHRIWICIARTALRPFPRAAESFQHFLQGSGEAQTCSLQRLFQEDPSLFAQLQRQLNVSLTDQKTQGILDLPQSSFHNWDWRLALGNLSLQWKRIGEDIEVSGRKMYDWTPHTRRISRPIHRAAQRAKEENGANAFQFLFAPTRIPIALARSTPAGKPPHPGLFQRLYL